MKEEPFHGLAVFSSLDSMEMVLPHPYTHSSRLLANPQDVLCDSDLRRAFENKRRIPVVFLILAFSHRSKGHEKEDWLRRGRIRV